MLTAIVIFIVLLSFSVSEFGIIVLGFHCCVNGGLLQREYSRPFGCCTGRVLRVKCTTENGAGAVGGELESVKEEAGEVDQAIDKAVGEEKMGPFVI